VRRDNCCRATRRLHVLGIFVIEIAMSSRVFVDILFVWSLPSFPPQPSCQRGNGRIAITLPAEKLNDPFTPFLASLSPFLSFRPGRDVNIHAVHCPLLPFTIQRPPPPSCGHSRCLLHFPREPCTRARPPSSATTHGCAVSPAPLVLRCRQSGCHLPLRCRNSGRLYLRRRCGQSGCAMISASPDNSFQTLRRAHVLGSF
jgi:hypothetical protein